MNKACSDVRVKLKEESKCKCHTYASQQIDMAENFPSIELNDQVLEIVRSSVILVTD